MRIAPALALIVIALALPVLAPSPAGAAPHRARHKDRSHGKKPKPAAPTPVPTREPAPEPTPAAPAPAATTSTGTTTTPSPTGMAGATMPPSGPSTPLVTSTPTTTTPPAPEPAGADAADVDALRQEYLALRDELFQSRARASAVASQLYSTRIQVKLTYTTARFYNPAKATIRLDGATVYDNQSGAIGGDDGVRFDGYVAPGRHLITFHVEATGKDDDSFASTTETQIVVKAIAGKDLVVAARAKDAGDIAYEWKRKEKGSYGLGIDVAVSTQARAATPGGSGSKAGRK